MVTIMNSACNMFLVNTGSDRTIIPWHSSNVPG